MGILRKITDEYFGDTVREEEGLKVRIGDDEYILEYEYYPFAKELKETVDGGDGFVKFKSPFYGNETMYGCCQKKMGRFGSEIRIYYVVSEKSLLEAPGKRIEEGCLRKEAVTYNEYDIMKDSFLPLQILKDALEGKDIDIIDFDKPFNVRKEYHGYYIENVLDYIIFVTEEVAQEAAVQGSVELFNEENNDHMKKDEVNRLINIIGDSWILMNNVKDLYREQRVSYYESEGMDTDETEDIVDKEMNDEKTDFLQKAMSVEGFLPNNCYDMEKLAELCVNHDGRGNFLSTFDCEEYMCNIDGTEYYVYIR